MKKRTIAAIAVAGFIGVGAIASAGSNADTTDAAKDTNPSVTATTDGTAAKSTEEPKAEEPKAEEPKAEEPKAEEPKYTKSQEQALRAAKSYVDSMPFSKKGLIDQLTSEYGSGFSVADATFAANNVGADWKAEAVEAAESYLDTMAFSRSGLIDQLTSEYGSQFTRAQAEHAADAVGL